MIETRYGVFLRPDPATCWSVTQITFALERQFGLVSAGAFPPHGTLIGNLATEASERELVAALDPVFAGLEPFTVVNSGVARGASGGFEYNINLDAQQKVNEPLGAVARAVKDALLPLSTPVDDFLVSPVADYRFAGHLGLASHELSIDNSLSDQVGDFIEGLPVTPPPTSFRARWFSLFEFRSDWSTHWWTTMTWRHLDSWEIA